MKRPETIVGIDIGSTHVRAVVGAPVEGDRVQVIGVGESAARGVSRGNIVDLEDAVTSLSEALEQAERMIGSPLSRAVVAVSGAHSKVIESKGVVAVAKPNGAVTQSDVDRADEQSQAVATAPNYEILHVIPRYYNLDNQEHIKDPIGMSGVKLEAHTQIILALSSQINLLTKCLHRTQLELDGLVFAPLATAQAAITHRQRDLGVALVNLGAWTTSVSIFENGELLHANVLAVGSEHITGDLAIGARVDIDVAEQIKIEQGLTPSEKLSKRDEIDIAKYARGTMPRTLYSRKEIAEIIEARLTEIFTMISHELKKVGKAGKLPAGLVLTGGGSKLRGIVEFAKESVRLPVFLGSTENVLSPIDKVRDPRFSTALGLIHYSNAEKTEGAMGTYVAWAQRTLGGIARKIRGLPS